MSQPFVRITGLIFACLFPTLLTWIYFVMLADDSASLQKSVYAIGKIIQFTFPLWFLAWLIKTKIKLPLKFNKEIVVGILFGLGVVFLMIGIFNSPLFEGGTMTTLQAAVQEKVAGLGLNTVWKYILLGLFYSTFHSLLEEYYWRWFVYGQLRTSMGKIYANLLSSLGFIAHHVLVLAVFFGLENPLTYILALAVGLGGSFWAWHYERTQSLVGPWLSHMLVDAAIFYIGYQLIQF